LRSRRARRLARTAAKKTTRQITLARPAEMLQVRKLSERESGTDFKKSIWEPLVTELAAFVNRLYFLWKFSMSQYRY
jgi:hypothetical protein